MAKYNPRGIWRNITQGVYTLKCIESFTIYHHKVCIYMYIYYKGKEDLNIRKKDLKR